MACQPSGSRSQRCEERGCSQLEGVPWEPGGVAGRQLGKEGGGGGVGNLCTGPSDCSGPQVASAPSLAQAHPHLLVTQGYLVPMVESQALPSAFSTVCIGGCSP